MLCYAMLCYAMLCYAMLFYSTTPYIELLCLFEPAPRTTWTCDYNYVKNIQESSCMLNNAPATHLIMSYEYASARSYTWFFKHFLFFTSSNLVCVFVTVGSVFMHIDCDNHHFTSLRATAEDRMGGIFCYYCPMDYIHAFRGDSRIKLRVILWLLNQWF